MSSGVSPRLGRRFLIAWDYLTAPSPAIQEPRYRRQAQLLAAFHIVVVAGGIILSLLNYCLLPLRPPPWITWGMMGICIVLMCGTYAFSRSTHYRLAALGAFGVFSGFLFFSAAVHLFPVGTGVLYYLCFPLVAISFFFSIQATLLFTAANLSAMALLPLLNQNHLLPEVLYGPATFLVFATLLVIFVKYQRDLLERDRQAELTLQKEQLRVITDNMRDIVAHVSSDGVIRYISPSLYTVLGYLPEIATGQQGSMWEMLVHPDDVEQFRGELFNMLNYANAKGTPYRVRHADGHYVWLEGSGNPLRDATGKLVGVILVTRDITERKQAEQALQASEIKFRMVADTVDASIMLLRDDQTLYVNPGATKLTGYSTDELKTMPILNIIHPDDRDIVLRRFQARLRGEPAPASYEIRTVNKAGEVRWNLLSAARLMYEGQPTIISTAIDVTDTKQAENQRLDLALERQKMKLLRRFLSDVSHDLRSPLTTIGTSLYLLRKSPTHEKRDYHIEVLSAQFAHLDRVLQDLLSIARLENEQDEFQFLQVDLNPFLEDIVRKHQAAAAQKRHRLQFNPASASRHLQCDTKQLRRAIGNLLANSFTFTPEGGTISVALHAEDKHMRIDVYDSGSGIADEDLPHIFEHFYRGDKARSVDTGGAGLGLTIARRIIEAHGGHISAENEPAGGSRFRILLPVD